MKRSYCSIGNIIIIIMICRPCSSWTTWFYVHKVAIRLSGDVRHASRPRAWKRGGGTKFTNKQTWRERLIPLSSRCFSGICLKFHEEKENMRKFLCWLMLTTEMKDKIGVFNEFLRSQSVYDNSMKLSWTRYFDSLKAKKPVSINN